MKIIFGIIAAAQVLFLFVSANKFSAQSGTKSKAKKMLLAEGLLNDYQKFYNKADKFRSIAYKINEIFLKFFGLNIFRWKWS